MEVLNINEFLLLKSNIDFQKLDNPILDFLNKLFCQFDKNKKHKKLRKPVSNILKNQRIQTKKETITNRVNLILNKLSESNIDSLIIDFLENINQIDLETFEEIQKTFYLKIISEINFIKIYLQFLKIIGYIYEKVQNYNLSFFYSLIEIKFKSDYLKYIIEPSSFFLKKKDNVTLGEILSPNEPSHSKSEMLLQKATPFDEPSMKNGVFPEATFSEKSKDFLENDPYNKLFFINSLVGETKRINNLIIIKNMVEYKFISQSLIEFCDNIILNQKEYLPDIYYWFNSKNRLLSVSENIKINEILKLSINMREKVLLENLINKKIVVTSIKSNSLIINNELAKCDTLKLECENIIDEYLLIKSIDDIKYFIETRCTDAIAKNKYCEYLLNKYFLTNKENAKEIIELIKQLIKIQLLYKSNISRGLLMIYCNWKERLPDYEKSNEKMKNLLNVLKNCGITKGIEHIIDQYKINI
jgi:hypothetical protein